MGFSIGHTPGKFGNLRNIGVIRFAPIDNSYLFMFFLQFVFYDKLPDLFDQPYRTSPALASNAPCLSVRNRYSREAPAVLQDKRIEMKI
jgi:hypothetical protein